ncbi:hypothetical protein [Streptomyces sp. NPDC058145]|uniref:hypothetical protein n=1 Tax=Streptomyces sp. NPDC058145 TaxID=3346356 RepID=UPI0036E1AB21
MASAAGASASRSSTVVSRGVSAQSAARSSDAPAGARDRRHSSSSRRCRSTTAVSGWARSAIVRWPSVKSVPDRRTRQPVTGAEPPGSGTPGTWSTSSTAPSSPAVALPRRTRPAAVIN